MPEKLFQNAVILSALYGYWHRFLWGTDQRGRTCEDRFAVAGIRLVRQLSGRLFRILQETKKALHPMQSLFVCLRAVSFSEQEHKSVFQPALLYKSTESLTCLLCPSDILLAYLPAGIERCLIQRDKAEMLFSLLIFRDCNSPVEFRKS